MPSKYPWSYWLLHWLSAMLWCAAVMSQFGIVWLLAVLFHIAVVDKFSVRP